MLVGVVNSGIGTIASMLNLFRHIGVPAVVANDPDQLSHLSHLVLPGVGHFSEGARRLAVGGWTQTVREYASSGKPVLGVCLGMQLLGERSEEGEGAGLGLIPFSLKKIEVAPGVPVPHMGWNTVKAVTDSPLLDLSEDARYYFVHSYAVSANDPSARGLTQYGEMFASVVSKENVHGVQFHPEKSHRFGMALLRNFVKLA